MKPPSGAQETRGTLTEIFLVFLRLGCTSFGGPVAHLGYYRAELVARRNWLTEATFADLVALCQFMPGPASSQTGMAIGLLRGGPPGMFAAWLGFTLPSAVAMTLFAYGVATIGDLSRAGWLIGLKLVAVAVVAQAVWGMARTLAPDRARATVAVAACLICLTVPSSPGQIAAILLGAILGLTVLPGEAAKTEPPVSMGIRIPAGIAVALLALFFALLAASAVIAIRNWRQDPAQRTFAHLLTWAMRVLVGCMWFQGSLWKLPLFSTENGLYYWTQQMVENSAFDWHRALVERVLLPAFTIVTDPLAYCAELGFAVSLILGVAVRPMGVLAAMFAANLWIGLYRHSGEWPWNYVFLALLMASFSLHAAGRSLGLDALLSRHWRRGRALPGR